MKKLTKEDAAELLRKYRMGVCSETEIEFINRWYHSFDHEQNDQTDPDSADSRTLKIRMLENITHRIEGAQHHEMTQHRQTPLKTIYLNNFAVLRRVAAVILIASAVAVFFYTRNDSFIGEVQTPRQMHDNISDLPEIVQATSPTTLYLSDGSVVWLKGASRLEYPRNFAGDAREVTLVGEAFFDVVPNKEKPFIIHSANFTTRVLGTSFNIKAYGDDDSQEVVVVTGKVVVSVKEPSTDNVKELVLTPNQKAIYIRKHNSLVESEVNGSAAEHIWKKRKLAFDDVSLEDILKVLSATHGANILMGNESMKNCIITADLSEESLAASIGILAKAIDATYTIKGNDIILSGNGCDVQK